MVPLTVLFMLNHFWRFHKNLLCLLNLNEERQLVTLEILVVSRGKESQDLHMSWEQS